MRLIDANALTMRVKDQLKYVSNANCDGDQYYSGEANALRYVLKVIRDESVARLMTLKEVKKAGYWPMYLETKDGELQMYCTLHCFHNETVFLSLGGFEKPQDFGLEYYGKEWRLWTWEPTVEQMEEETWQS